MGTGILVGSYNGTTVVVKGEPKQQYMELLILDAKRIMGLEKTTGKRRLENGEKEPPFYMTPPKEGTGEFEYATRLLSLTPPYLRIYNGISCIVVSAKDVTNIREV